MIVKCRKILSPRPDLQEMNDSPWLTIGTTYKVLCLFIDDYGVSYFIKSDFGEKGAFFEANQFDIISKNIPNHWVVAKNSSQNNFTILPESWDKYDYFFEKLSDDDLGALDLFIKESI